MAEVETMDYAAMMRRVLRSWGLRLADADMEDFAELITFRREVTRLQQSVVDALRARGASWSEIGRGAGITKQTAQERWGR